MAIMTVEFTMALVKSQTGIPLERRNHNKLIVTNQTDRKEMGLNPTTFIVPDELFLEILMLNPFVLEGSLVISLFEQLN